MFALVKVSVFDGRYKCERYVKFCINNLPYHMYLHESEIEEIDPDEFYIRLSCSKESYFDSMSKTRQFQPDTYRLMHSSAYCDSAIDSIVVVNEGCNSTIIIEE